jgi:predicted regulator of Ras-like GTPase activity (Roadblock/LC7/MglB family)
MMVRGRGTLILSTMEAMSQERALRYLLELSTDIRVAMLIDDKGLLMAAAPERPGEQIADVASELAGQARLMAANGGQGQVEVDVTVEGGAVFALCEGGPAMVCVTGPMALPGLILHDMRLALDDLRRGERETA